MGLNEKDLVGCTVGIISTMNDGTRISGTGFFFSFDSGTERKVAIVAVKHIVKNVGECVLRFIVEGNGEEFVYQSVPGLIGDSSEGPWIAHPNPDIDLCILPAEYIYNKLENEGKRISYAVLPEDSMPTKRTYELMSLFEDFIYVVYPEKIDEQGPSQSVIRLGINSTPLNPDYINNPFFYIDATIYGGSSGSPVFLYQHPIFHGDDGHLYHGIQYRLIGVLQAAVDHNAYGKIDYTDSRGESFKMAPVPVTPNDFGRVIKIEYLRDFRDIF